MPRARRARYHGERVSERGAVGNRGGGGSEDPPSHESGQQESGHLGRCTDNDCKRCEIRNRVSRCRALPLRSNVLTMRELEAQKLDNLVAMRRSAVPSMGLLEFPPTSSTSTIAAPFRRGAWGAFIGSQPRIPTDQSADMPSSSRGRRRRRRRQGESANNNRTEQPTSEPKDK